MQCLKRTRNETLRQCYQRLALVDLITEIDELGLEKLMNGFKGTSAAKVTQPYPNSSLIKSIK